MKKKLVFMPLLAMMFFSVCAFAQEKIQAVANVLVRINGNETYFFIDYQDYEHGNADEVFDEVLIVNSSTPCTILKDNTFFDLQKIDFKREPKESAYFIIRTVETYYISENGNVPRGYAYANQMQGEMTYMPLTDGKYTIDNVGKMKKFVFPTTKR